MEQVHYLLVAKSSRVLAEHRRKRGLPRAAALLSRAPALHSKYWHTERDLVTCYLTDGRWSYCMIVEQRYGKDLAFCKLELLRDDLKQLIESTQLGPQDDIGPLVASLLRDRFGRSRACWYRRLNLIITANLLLGTLLLLCKRLA